MLRLSALVAVSALIAGCVFDCDFPDYGTRTDSLFDTADVPVSDTLVVRVVAAPDVAGWVSVFVPAEGVELSRSPYGETIVWGRAEVSDYEPVRTVRLKSEARGDTLVATLTREDAVALAALPPCAGVVGPVRPVCSPASPDIEVVIYGVEAPEGVRAVRVEYDDPRRGLRTMPSPVRG